MSKVNNKQVCKCDGIQTGCQDVHCPSNSTALTPPASRPTDKLAWALIDHKEQEKKQILGKVLTLIDATVVEPTQNKALKDLIKQSFSENNQAYWDGLEAMIGQWVRKYDLDLELSPYVTENMPKFMFEL